MIDFKPLTLADREAVEAVLMAHGDRGCEYNYLNLYAWGRQRFAWVGGCLTLFSQFSRRSVYPFPLGEENRKEALDAIIQDACERGISCRLTSLGAAECRLLDQLYPGRFRIHCDRDSFDYVYDIQDLADLKGRKFQKKRNHIHQFQQRHPQARAVPLEAGLLPQVRQLAQAWYQKRMEEDPQGDYHMERAALGRVLDHWQELAPWGLCLLEGEEMLAFTLGTPLTGDTVDVHFEKALTEEAYPMINREFARYLRDSNPELRYLNREDDLGLAGLRKAKLSYQPHHLTEKYWACLLEDGYDY